MSSAKLFVVSAPSGCGKGTILAEVMKRRDVYYSISYTTRKKREGEQEGVNYFFVDRKQFEKMIDDHDFLEYARYVDNYYGTPKIPVFEQLARGRDVILEIDTEGAFQVKKEFSDAVLIFILPPSVTELFRRLEKRGTESKESLRQRTILAKREMTCSYRFDYVVLNDDLDKAVDDMLLLMNAVREGTPEAEHFSTDGDDANRLIEEVVTNA